MFVHDCVWVYGFQCLCVRRTKGGRVREKELQIQLGRHLRCDKSDKICNTSVL